MIAGHAAVALVAKTKAPSVSLGWFMAVTYGLDLLWPVFLLIGAERVEISPGATAFTPLRFDHYPWSHSLLMSVVWGGSAFALAVLAGLERPTALLLGAVVVSYWFLDLPMHQPDLPLWPGTSPEVGLGLWRSVPGTLAVEGAVFAAGLLLYLKESRARDRIGSVGPAPAQRARARDLCAVPLALRNLGGLGGSPSHDPEGRLRCNISMTLCEVRPSP